MCDRIQLLLLHQLVPQVGLEPTRLKREVDLQSTEPANCSTMA